MIISAGSVNLLPMCKGCPRKRLVSENVISADSQEFCFDISVHCENERYCQFALDRYSEYIKKMEETK